MSFILPHETPGIIGNYQFHDRGTTQIQVAPLEVYSSGALVRARFWLNNFETIDDDLGCVVVPTEGKELARIRLLSNDAEIEYRGHGPTQTWRNDDAPVSDGSWDLEAWWEKEQWSSPLRVVWGLGPIDLLVHQGGEELFNASLQSVRLR